MDVQGKLAVVMGLGSFSGGISAARFLARRGARVVVTDLASAEALEQSIAALAGAPIDALHLGGHRREDFYHAEIVVASPAVREDDQFLAIARERGAVITTEMNLFFELCAAPIIGVTGSNGKSTTAALLHAMVRESGRPCWLGGNIGRSLLERVDEIDPADVVILELSSFQLEDLDTLRRSPHLAVVTTFTANHLDRHPDLASYRAAKQAILRYQTAQDLAVLNADDADVSGWPAKGLVWYYGLEDHGRDGAFFDRDRLVLRRQGVETEFEVLDAFGLPGAHNQSNLAGAACAAAWYGLETEPLRRALESFRTLPHRLEPVAEFKGRRFYDDSIATTPESTIAALQSLQGRIWLIAGGHDKGSDFSEVARRIASRVEGVALLGATAPRLRGLIERSAAEAGSIAAAEGLARSGRPVLCECTDMRSAVDWCFAASGPGDIVLLSPACASFGMFRNFVDRAMQFRQCVQALAATWRRAG